MFKKIKKWIVVMDGKHARFYSNSSDNGGLVQVNALENDWERSEASTRKSLGRAFDSAGAGRHAIEPHTDERTQEKKQFVHKVMQYLEGGFTSGSFLNLILVAPPKILGLLRQELSKHLRDIVAAEVDKDLVQLSPSQIQDKLREYVLV